MTRPVLLLEINEVPWRVIDRALDVGRFPALTRFFRAARTWTTQSHDTGELSPWVTWPSLHRGLTNEEHGVRNLGQDVSTFAGIPIWEEVRRRGHDVGVFGSMQSWPPTDPGPGGFFVPDTFAPDERCIPASVAPLQALNLALVAANGRVVKRDMPKLPLAAAAGAAALRLGLPPRLAARVARQLVEERLVPARVTRRPIYQTILFWEVFKRLFRPEAAPTLTTFFTNHVASAMHRYWADFFPEDFPGRPARPEYASTLWFALEVLEEMMVDVERMRSRRPDLTVVFASSMGQAAVHREHHGRELVLRSVEELMKTLEGAAPVAYRRLLAMVPQVAVEIASDQERARVTHILEGARFVDGSAVFSVDTRGQTLSITSRTPTPAALDAGVALVDGRAAEFATLGFDVVEVEPGTAYHIPEGVLAAIGPGLAPSKSRTPIAATEVKSLLLEWTEVRSAGADRSVSRAC